MESFHFVTEVIIRHWFQCLQSEAHDSLPGSYLANDLCDINYDLICSSIAHFERGKKYKKKVLFVLYSKAERFPSVLCLFEVNMSHRDSPSLISAECTKFLRFRTPLREKRPFSVDLVSRIAGSLARTFGNAELADSRALLHRKKCSISWLNRIPTEGCTVSNTNW